MCKKNAHFSSNSLPHLLHRYGFWNPWYPIWMLYMIESINAISQNLQTWLPESRTDFPLLPVVSKSASGSITVWWSPFPVVVASFPEDKPDDPSDLTSSKSSDGPEFKLSRSWSVAPPDPEVNIFRSILKAFPLRREDFPLPAVDAWDPDWGLEGMGDSMSFLFWCTLWPEKRGNYDFFSVKKLHFLLVQK